jgi:hypothetical protein
MHAEGWYRDPYGVHEDRWFSDGTPTALVKDAGVEGKDPPPAGEPAQPLVVSTPAAPGSPDDLRRAGETAPATKADQVTTMMDAFAWLGPH